MTQLVERPGRRALYRSRSLQEKHRRVGAGGALEVEAYFLERRILADNLRKPVAGCVLLFENEVLGEKASLSDRALHQHQQVIGVDRLGEEIEGAVFHRRDGVLHGAVSGHDDDGHIGIGFACRLENIHAAATG